MRDQTKKLAEIFLKNKTTKEMVLFLDGILTPTELDEITTRIQIVQMLKKGVSQRVIAEKLGVGIATVTRGSKELKLGKFIYV